jgi:glycosyltransferase involved in cell wall biosynthesis
VDEKNDYTLLLPKKFSYDTSVLGRNFTLTDVPGLMNRVLWENFNLPGHIRKSSPDVFFCPDYTLPVTLTTPAVITVHDLTFMRHPEGLSRKARLLYGRFFPRSARKAKLILADSEHTKRDIIELGLKDEEQVRTVHLGVDEAFFKDRTEDEITEALSRYGLERGYILFVGAIEERKNIRRLIEGYKLLKGSGKDLPPLILAGPKLDMADEILSAATGVAGVRHLGYVDDAHLPSLYQGAAGFVYPSLYEGFGLPPLEAMAAGIPVAVSRLTSIPEVVGDCGVYIDNPELVDGIAEGINALLSLGPERDEMVIAARSRATGFTWKRCAENTLNALLDVAAM